MSPSGSTNLHIADHEALPTSRAELDALIARRVEELLPAKLAELRAQERQNQPGKLAMIATKGTLDWAYPPFILGSTAAALGWEVSVFFTFYGLNLLKRDLSELRVSALGNPAMPMKMPFGPTWLQRTNWNIPNVLQANLPGFEKLATHLMRQTVHKSGVASVEELRELCLEAGVQLIACQMTVDLFGFDTKDFIVEVGNYCGAATFLPTAREADVCLFI